MMKVERREIGLRGREEEEILENKEQNCVSSCVGRDGEMEREEGKRVKEENLGSKVVMIINKMVAVNEVIGKRRK